MYVWSCTHGLSLPAWTTGLSEVERGGVGIEDERKPCTVISEVLRFKSCGSVLRFNLVLDFLLILFLFSASHVVLSKCVYDWVHSKCRVRDATSAAGSIDWGGYTQILWQSKEGTETVWNRALCCLATACLLPDKARVVRPCRWLTDKALTEAVKPC